MKIYVARHGQTEWNKQNRVLGKTDIPLTETGCNQAYVLAERLKSEHIDLIIASPLSRARQTAEICAAELKLNIVLDSRLKELNYGIYEGVSRNSEDFQKKRRQCSYRMPGGESVFDVIYRVYDFLDEIKIKYHDKNILTVTHGGICRAIKSYFENLTNDGYFSFFQENCEIKIYRI